MSKALKRMKYMNRRKFVAQILIGLPFVSAVQMSSYAETYIIKKGDTLYRIALEYGVSVRDLKSLNRLKSDTIRIGQKLVIESTGPDIKTVRKATDKIKFNKKKWEYIVVHHSATSYGNAESYNRVHSQRMENGLAYHFVIGNGRNSKDGEIEIGSRWIKQLHGGHVSSQEYNNHGIGICLVGNFEKDKPTQKQIISLKQLIRFLGNDLLDGKFKFLVHKEINSTLCPGKNFPTKEFHKIFG